MFGPTLRVALALAVAIALQVSAAPASAAAGGRVSVSGTYLSRDGNPFNVYGASVYPSGGVGWKDSGFRGYFDARVNDAVSGGLNTLRLTDFINGVTTDIYDPIVWGNVDYAIGKAAIPVGAWTQIKSDIGRWLNGKIIDRIWVAYDQPPNTGAFRGYLDDIVMTNGDLG